MFGFMFLNIKIKSFENKITFSLFGFMNYLFYLCKIIEIRLNRH